MIIQCVARKWVLLSIASCAFLASQQSTWGAGPGEGFPTHQPHRVVMHLNSGDEKVQRGALNNIKNLYQALGRERLTVELVVHGAGLPFLIKKHTTSAAELTDLKQVYDVQYTACSNTMKAMNVMREDLIDEVGDTVSAMVRLMERQEQGWVYIKP